MKRSIIAATSAAILLGGTVIAAAPAQSAGCVTPKEFARAKAGMSMSQVHRIFGTKGRESARTEGYGITIVIRDYDACTQFGAVSVLYENGVLSTKSGVF